MTKVQELLERKRRDVKARWKPLLLPDDNRRVRWSKDRFRIIAEIKRSSLSAGQIRKQIDIETLALDYERAGVSGISVLTEEHYFGGSLDDLKSARKTVTVPLLQKDFIIDEFQIREAKAAGADFILLIARFLSTAELEAYLQLCEEIGINALVEITDADDLSKLTQPVRFLGVNSRDLETLQVDTSKFRELRKLLPEESFLIAESGIDTLNLLCDVIALGYNGALIGEHFLRSEDPEKEARRFVEFARAQVKVKICGITNERDVFAAMESGAQALGFIFADSPRRIDPSVLAQFRDRIPARVLTVGVFRGQTREEIIFNMRKFSLDIAQIYDPIEVPFPVWPARTIHDSKEEQKIATDLRGFTRMEKTKSSENPWQEITDSMDVENILWDVKVERQKLPSVWKQLSNSTGKVFALAGGLDSENVKEAISLCHPEWIDVARGVEKVPGLKDEKKINAFIKAVRGTV